MQTIIKYFSILIIICLGLIVCPITVSASQNHQIINHDLQQSLVTDQAYANDDPGNYDYAKFIRQVRYTGNGRIMVVVNAGFNKMSKVDKTRIMEQVQGLAIAVLKHHHRISNKAAKQGLTATIRVGQSTIGRSQNNNHYQYRWK